MRKYLVRLVYRLGIPLATSRAYHVAPCGRLMHRRWLSHRHAAPLERPVARFSATGQLLDHQ